jgi:putative NIF3 family GTP cyclohydrolase 1 type 2
MDMDWGKCVFAMGIIYIKDVIEALTSPAIEIENTVDRLEFGKQDEIVKGIAVTFLATQEVISEANKLGVNLIISHEGIFFSHRAKLHKLQSNRVFQQKRRTIDENGLAIYRYHDHIHRYLPDAITAGLLQSLGWQAYEVENLPAATICSIPGLTLQEVNLHVKERLGMQFIRYVGDLSVPCRRVGLLVGYRGHGGSAILLSEEKNLDLLIYGEGPEWETPEYTRDAVLQGKQKALIVLGHAESEMPGMRFLAAKLQEKFPGVPVRFIAQKPVFQIF